MKIIKYALLLSGLFFSFYSFAALTPNYDPNDWKPATKKPGQWCASAPSPATSKVQEYACEITKEAAVSSSASAVATELTGLCAGVPDRRGCSVTVSKTDELSATYTLSFNRVVYTNPTTGEEITTPEKMIDYRTTLFSFKQSGERYACPPTEKDATPEQVLLLSKYTIGAFQVDGIYRCYKPNDPLDCSGIKGLGASALYDSFITDAAAGYNKENPPSCLTKCAKDESGVEKCGDCKVAAASWSYQGSPTSTTQKWWANAGTFTGAACGEKESEEPPPEQTKCWETTNGLSMCIQDPAEKCVTVSGVQQCEAGCGFINGAFYCADKEPPKPNPNDKDKPLPEPDDNISNPEKPIGEMNKGDFKDVQRGVESRVASVGVAVGNLENSVDGLGNTLDSMNDKLDKANGIGEAQLGYLKGIKDAVTDGDDGGEPDGNCDPLKDKKCDGNTGASGIKSWWNSKYPDGLGGLMAEKKEAFFQSEAYKAITFEITTGGGTLPVWNFCMNMGFADYGCKDLSLPSWIWGFIKACMMFGAAILCRRLLIGA